MSPFAMVALAIVGTLLLIAAIGIAAYFAGKKRTEELRAVAAELSFDFLEDDEEVLAHLGEFNLFSAGHSRKLQNLMRGTSSDTGVSIFDYRYTTGGGKNSSTHRQTVICFQSGRLELPKFALRPESWIHKIGGMLGYHDIDFADYPEFSRRYLLRGEDEQAIRDVFTAAVIEYFERLPDICAEGDAGRLVVYRSGKIVKPHELRHFLETSFGVYAALAHATSG